MSDLVESRFDEFWAAWPKNGTPPFDNYVRKTNPAGCRKKWKEKNLDAIADEVIHDVELRAKYDKQWRNNAGEFMQGPLPYLNQENWKVPFADLRDRRKVEEASSPSIKPDEILAYLLKHKSLSPNQRRMTYIQGREGGIIGVLVRDDPEEGYPGFRFMVDEMLSESV